MSVNANELMQGAYRAAAGTREVIDPGDDAIEAKTVPDSHSPRAENTVTSLYDSLVAQASAASDTTGDSGESEGKATPSPEPAGLGELDPADIAFFENPLRPAFDAVFNAVKENPVRAFLGAVIGVGAVAAAPFTGGGSVLGATTLIGSLTGAGVAATAAGVVGAGTVAVLSENANKSDKETSFREGHQLGTAEQAAIVIAQENMIKKSAASQDEQEKIYTIAVYVAAIGFAMAACDGVISPEERNHVLEYVFGAQMLPKQIVYRLDALYSSPPDFCGAMLYAKALGSQNWRNIDNVLLIVDKACGDSNAEKQDFLNKWDAFKTMQHQEGASS